jgi:ribosomal protein S9
MEILARAVGRRKEAVAQVQIVKGTGKFLINNKSAQEYLQNSMSALITVKLPFDVLKTNLLSSEATLEFSSSTVSSGSLLNIVTLEEKNQTLLKIDTIVKVKGGGLIGQSDAIKLGIARAICSKAFKELVSSKEVSIDPIPSLSKLDLITFDGAELQSKQLLSASNEASSKQVIEQAQDKPQVASSPKVREVASGSLEVLDTTSTETDKITILSPAQQEIVPTDIRKKLKTKGYLTQDSRVKERRKYGLKKARKAPQYHKR